MSDNLENAAENETPRVQKFRWWYVLIGLAVLLIGAAAGGYLGYRAGLQLRLSAQSEQVVMLATQQFQQGVIDLDSGRFETARKRFEYVISLDPSFPGASDKLAEAMIGQSQKLTPTPEAEPTLAPTPDTRNEEQLFAQIQQDMGSQNWENAFLTIGKLRDLNINYRTVDVDGMYYITLRFLGIQKIQQGQLEVGNYYLTLSDRFAPLDVDGKNYRDWSRLYLSAASFWGVDWGRVVAAFGEIYPSLPNLMDSSFITATERFRQASINYGDFLFTNEQYCDAQKQYENGLAIGADAHGQEGLSKAAEYCANPPNQPEQVQPGVTPSPELTPSPGTGTPETLPTDIPVGPTVVPTEEPSVVVP